LKAFILCVKILVSLVITILYKPYLNRNIKIYMSALIYESCIIYFVKYINCDYGHYTINYMCALRYCKPARVLLTLALRTEYTV